MRIGVVLSVVLGLVWPAAAWAQLDVVRVSTGPGLGAGPSGSSMLVSSRDGARAIFYSDRRLIAEDADDEGDWYQRAGESTTTVHPVGLLAQPLFSISADGAAALFDGYRSWTGDDTNENRDAYLVRDGQVQRVTAGHGGQAAGMSGDGSRVIIYTDAQYTADDQNLGWDLYAWEAGTHTRISPTPAQANGQLVDFLAESVDARAVLYRSLMPLTADDTDEQRDLFLTRGQSTVKVSPGNGAIEPDFQDMTTDATHVLLTTTERLVAGDTDDKLDVYRIDGTNPVRVTAGVDDVYASAQFLTDDGRVIAINTRARLTADDTDGQSDGYVWRDGDLQRVTKGPSGGNAETLGPAGGFQRGADAFVAPGAEDGSTVIISTIEGLTPDDTDGHRRDMYEWRGGEVVRVTTGPSGGNSEYELNCGSDDGPKCGGSLEHVSPDGSRILFTSIEPLVPEDTDDLVDVYQRAGGVTTLLSPARAGRTVDKPVWLADASDDGTIAFLETQEQMTADDTDEGTDFFRVRAPAPGVIVPGAGGADAGAPLQGGAALPNAAQPARLLRLLNRPRRLRLTRGRTRVARRGQGLRFELPHRERVTVTLRRLRPGRRSVFAGRLRLVLPLGRSTIVLGERLSKRRKLRAGRYVVIVAADYATSAEVAVRLLAPRRR